MKAKIDLEKFTCSLMKRYYEIHNIDPLTTRCWLDKVLEDQGLEYKDGEIVEISQEGKDEMIIKALKEGFKYHQLFNPTFGGIPCTEIVNWFEKQSEQKLAKWTDSDEEHFQHSLLAIKTSLYTQELRKELVDWLKNVKQKLEQ